MVLGLVMVELAELGLVAVALVVQVAKLAQEELVVLLEELVEVAVTHGVLMVGLVQLEKWKFPLVEREPLLQEFLV